MQGQQPSLEKHVIWLMVAVALFFDAVQALLDLVGIGWIFIPIAYATFWLWFKMHGIKFFSMKRAPTLGVGAILEVITAGIIPAMTLTVLRIALDYKVKEATGKIVGNISPKPADNDSEMSEAA